MTHTVTLFFIVLLSAPAVIQCISVVGPKVLRPYGTYRVAVAGGTRAHTLYVAVEGRQANGEQFTQGREVQIQPAASRVIELEIEDPGPGQYSLIARSTSGPLFSSAATLSYQPRSFCVFVQTDKRVYQPEDTINFRVVALDKYLLPLTGTVDVSVVDARGAAVRQWAAAPLDRGVLSDTLVLADEPGLGEWTIQVEVRGQKYSRQILVADYVKPKFHLALDMPKEVLFSEGRFTINVTARHFNGLPVRGELTLSAYPVFFSGLLQPVVSSPARKVVPINGNVEIVYDLKTDLDLAEDAARPLVVEAVLEEKKTLIKQNVTSRILLLRTPYRLKVSAPEYFKPGLPYNVQIEVVDPAGQIIDTAGEVSIERLWDDGAPVNVTNATLNRGLATYSITPDVAHAGSGLNLVIKYRGVTERVVNVRGAAGGAGGAGGGPQLGVELLTRGTGAGDELRARITATEPMDIVHYVVIGRGDVQLAKTVELSPPRRSVDVSVQVSWGMSPGCTLLAWYPRAEAPSAVLAAAVYAPQRRLLQHEVSVSESGGAYRPGSVVEFRVSGASGAHAALLAQDSAAAAAGLAARDGRGSGLELLTIEREVESFSGLPHALFKNEDHLPGLGIDLSGNTTADVLHNAGVVFLTDSVVTTSGNTGTSKEAVPETGTRPPLAGPYAFSRLPEPPAPRYYLTDVPQPTWMVANFTIGSDGQGAENRLSPITGGDWLLGGFAVHPTLGLGLAKPQNFTTSLPLTMTAELPDTLQKGETFAAIITLKSTLTVDTSIEITFHNSEQYFEFEPLDNGLDNVKKIELFRRVRVLVPARGSASAAFLVSAVRSGEAPVIAEATGNGVSASLFRTIDVKDGYEEEIWSWIVLDARRSVARANVTLEAAPGARLGVVSLLAAGDLLAAPLETSRSPPAPAADPGHALRPMAVASIILGYLQATGRDEDSAVVERARAQVAAGYQRLMAYRRSDGSFASDIDPDSAGDVWATALAARWISRASKYVGVSRGADAAAARWLQRAQAPAGNWPAPAAAPVDPRAQQNLPLTAVVLRALLQAPGSDRNVINKAVDYLAKNLAPELDAYTLANMADALAAARHPAATQALQYLDKYTNTTESTVFWSRKLNGGEWRNPWLRGNSVAGSAAAAALRAMLAARAADAAPQVAAFLLQTVRPDTQDPDVLDALAQYAVTLSGGRKLRVSASVAGGDEPRHFSLDDDNALIVQRQLVRNAQMASASTEGRGVACVGLSARSSTNVTAAWPRYTLDPRVDQVSTPYRLQLSICVGFVAQGNETESGLTLLTVQLPSGYLADINTLTELTSARHVSRARLQAGGARVVSWLHTSRAERCATLAAPRALPVARQRPGYATLEDLYDSSHRARVFFQPLPATACDVCREWESCARACGASLQRRAPDGADDDRDSADVAAADTDKPNTAASNVLSAVVAVVATLVLALR